MDTSAPHVDAAKLQRLHALEGTLDLPAGGEVASTNSSVLDTDDHSAFPSLASSVVPAARTPKSTAWGADSGPRIKATIRSQPIVSDSFTLSAIELAANRDGKPSSLGEIMKQVMSKFKVKIEASANQRARQTTFHIRSESQRELDKAKRNLLALLSPVVTLTLSAPFSTIPAIIGPKGANLKHVREQTGVKVDIPRRESVTPNDCPGGSANGITPADEEDEVLIPITITGPQPLAHEAQAMINEIILAKTSKSTQRVKNILPHIFPFVAARRALFIEGAQDCDINLTFNVPEREVTISGDREAVARVVQTIQETIESFQSVLISVKILLPKRQHRLLVGEALDEIMEKSQCSVIVPAVHEEGEEILVYGKQEDISAGLGAVMEKANSQYIHEFRLPGPITVSRQLLTYITRTNYPKTLSTAHPGVSVHIPSDTVINEASVLNVDIVGDKSLVDAVTEQVSELLGKLTGATKEISIDWLLHRAIMGNHAKRLKQLYELHNVQVFFPLGSAEQSSILLVYDPLSTSASPSLVDKEKHLNDVAEELFNISKDVADIKSEPIHVDKRWHEAVVGIDGTTLNAIIGEDKALSIKVGAKAGDPSGEDVILVRGNSTDVNRATKEILRILEDAKNGAIVTNYSTEFEIEKEYVGRVVGMQGTGVNRLRDQLGVKVDLSDEVEEKEKDKDNSKKKKTYQKSRVKITGRKENVEEARRRILSLVGRLADETLETLKIPAEFHASLIGPSGKYAIRLEERYSVKIIFPRGSSDNGESRTREVLKPDEVLVKGNKKGVADAKSELLEALEFEKESNKILQFTVPTRTVARILGRGGASINEIKDDTGAQIDVDRVTNDNVVTNITVRGTKEAIGDAKIAILAIVEQVGEEVTTSLLVETRFHRAIIGPGGQSLKDLIVRCGGPADSRSQAGLVRFPRQGEPIDEVRLRGEPALVNRIKAELENAVAALRDCVVLAVEIPAAQHRNLIGRGGQHLNELQTRTGVQIQFPGSRSYNQVGKAINVDETKDVDAADLVKVSGSRSACEAAIDELKARIQKVQTPVELLTAVVPVPLKYHPAILRQRNLFRSLRSYGVHVEQPPHPPNSSIPSYPPQKVVSTARIDDAEDDTLESKWQVELNYQDAEEGDSEWTLKAKDPEDLERAQGDIKAAIEQAEAMTHVGFLTIADRSVFPRIVGTKGSNVARLRVETGADITVSRDSNIIVIIGSESALEEAREAILRQAASLPRRRPG